MRFEWSGENRTQSLVLDTTGSVIYRESACCTGEEIDDGGYLAA
jgi:hypothetical protein